jgi:hypothetical protein
VRFVLAIVAFVFAAVLIVLGIAQRTVLLEPSSTSLSTSVEGAVPYTVIGSSALSANDGSQTLTVSGSDTVFISYGRTADIRAWLGDSEYAVVTHKDGASTLRAAVKTPTDTPSAAPTSGAQADQGPAATDPAAANPAGSDLWLEEFTAEKSLTTTINVPEGVSVLVASDGTKPAPASIRIYWPIDNSTPWAGPLIAAGALLALIGLALYLWALLHLRRSRGPRRNLPSGPRMPRLPRPPRPKSIKASQITGRKSITRSLVAVVPVMLVSGLVLSGCSADFWPKLGPSAVPSATATPLADAGTDAAEKISPPAVTVPQLERIVRRIAVLTKDADSSLNADAIATRFTGPALEQRVANYKIRAAIPDHAAPPALPASPLRLTLPQQASSWPRVVFSVIQNPDDPTVAPTAIVLRQESPRSNYLIEYAVQLEAAAKVPGVAPATIGAPIIPPDSNFLLMAPDQVASAYASILMQGEASPSFSMFQADGDTFRTQVGVDKKNEKKAALPTTAAIEFGTVAGSGKTVALATNDSGAIVAVSLSETETVKPVDAGATVSPEGASKALSGVSATAKGIQSTYGDQLLFHVPAAGSKDKIVLLGFAQGLTSSAELP